MIFGTGTDIIEIRRIENSIARNDAFVNKIFTEVEQAYCKAQKAGIFQSYAARYAAKEAVFKALGTGYRYGMAFREIEVKNDKLGKPEVMVHGKVKAFVDEQKITRIHLSLSHVKEMALAFVVLER
ncbi:Holo-[acyl-carrier-protein] synthase [hydrothermal vent metagenome]|uniref:Holo-[acyl-carrier-protein] synthase n=1 Tax=hydrothermal vent metagenome TaxID=652676 RepID=A0A3B0UEA3_9ZZZZ